MACESCKVVVKNALEELNIIPLKVELGEIETKGDVTDNQKKKLNSLIKKAGLELLEKKQGVLIEKIRKNKSLKSKSYKSIHEIGKKRMII